MKSNNRSGKTERRTLLVAGGILVLGVVTAAVVLGSPSATPRSDVGHQSSSAGMEASQSATVRGEEQNGIAPPGEEIPSGVYRNERYGFTLDVGSARVQAAEIAGGRLSSARSLLISSASHDHLGISVYDPASTFIGRDATHPAYALSAWDLCRHAQSVLRPLSGSSPIELDPIQLGDRTACGFIIEQPYADELFIGGLHGTVGRLQEDVLLFAQDGDRTIRLWFPNHVGQLWAVALSLRFD